MERKTRKIENLFVPAYERETKQNYYDLVYKLGQLEDLEEDFNIDLIILFKALTNGFIARYRFDSEFSKCIVGEDGITVDFKRKCFTNNFTDDWYFKDYGKTFALTKEELVDGR